ncbi:MAG: hypothetical protein ACLFN0_07020 [Thermovirgaceae bacterium]
MREKRQAEVWQDSRAAMFSRGPEQPAPAGNWWNSGGEPTPFDVRWRGPFEGYR